MFVFNILLFLNICISWCILGESSNGIDIKQWKCVDENCSSPISSAETERDYKTPSLDNQLLFKSKEKVVVLRKPAETEKQDYWWVKIGDNEGYAPKNYIREIQVRSRNLIVVNDHTLKSNAKDSHTQKNLVGGDPGGEIEDDGDKTTMNHSSEDKSELPEKVTTPGTVDSNETSSDIENQITFPPIKTNGNTETNQGESVNEEKGKDSSTILQSDNRNISGEDSKVNSIHSENTTAVPTLQEQQVPLTNQIGNFANDDPITNKNATTENKVPQSQNNTTKTEEDSLKNKEGNISSVGQGNNVSTSDGTNETYRENADISNFSRKQGHHTNDNIYKTNSNIQGEQGTHVSKNDTDLQKDQGPPKPENGTGTNTTNNIEGMRPTSTSESNIVNNINVQGTETHVSKNDNDLQRDQVHPQTENGTVNNSTNSNEGERQTSTMERNINNLQGTERHVSKTDSDFQREQEAQKVKNNDVFNTIQERQTTLTNMSNTVSEIQGEQGETSSTTSKLNNVKSSDGNHQGKIDALEVHVQEELEASSEGKDIVSTEKLEDNNSTGPDTENQTNQGKMDYSDTTTTAGYSPDRIKNYYSGNANNLDQQDTASDEGITPLPSPAMISADWSSQHADMLYTTTEPSVSMDDMSVKEIVEDDGDAWYSSIFYVIHTLNESFLKYFDFLKSESVDQYGNSQKWDNEEGGRSKVGSKRSHIDSPIPFIDNADLEFRTEPAPEDFWPPLTSILWFIALSFVILFCTLGYYYVENLGRDSELVRKNNELAKDLFVLEKEKINLDEELLILKGEVQKLTKDKIKTDEDLKNLNETLNRTKREKINLQERENELKTKVNLVEENYKVLKHILDESKQKAERTTLIDDIKKLKESIAADGIEISLLKEELVEKKQEIKTLNNNLLRTQETKKTLDERIDKLVIENNQITKSYQETLAQMEQTIEENEKFQSKLEDDLTKQKKLCESLLIEKELAESELQKAHGLTSTESLAEWLEVKDTRTSLAVAKKDLSKLIQERNYLMMDLKTTKENNETLSNKLDELNEKYEDAEKEKIDALTKLQVLSNYFKEKEIQLQEEFGMKEAMWLRKQSEDSTIYRQMKDLREENLKLKGSIEKLQKEIIDQEVSYKNIISTTEEKANDNWVLFKRTEVRFQEVQAEASQLRNKLATLEACDNSDEKLNKTVPLEVNGDVLLGSAMSPPPPSFMMFPNEFIPPPPIIPLPTSSAGGNPSSRPPPLGRISSPPLVQSTFMPPPPLMNYDMYSHVQQASPPSPSLPPSIHKPQPRDHHSQQLHMAQLPRKKKDSQSSNHSSESPLDKTPTRRSKR